MKSKKFWLGLLVLVLVFGMMVVGCGKDDDDKEWSDITSLKQLNGTWKGSYSGTEPIEGVDFTINYVAEITMTITATVDNSGTATGTIKTTMTVSGVGIDDIWEAFKYILSGDVEEEDDVTVTYDDENHSVIITQTIPSDTITLEEMAGTKINQNGTKIKQPADKEGTPEIILTKQ